MSIYLIEGRDLTVYPSLIDLTRGVEPDDVLTSSYVVLDDRGQGYRLRVFGRGFRRHVQAEPVDADRNQLDLLASLLAELGG